MSYSTESQVRKETGFADTALILTATITDAIASADGLINSKISRIYTIPLAISGTPTTPDLINELSKIIASAFLFMNTYGEESQGTDKGWEERLEWANGILDDIASQKVMLSDSSGVEFDRSSFKSPSYYPGKASSQPGEAAEPIMAMHKKY